MIDSRVAYHSAKRFLSILVWAVAGGVIGLAVPNLIDLSKEHLGSPIYALVPMVLIPLVYISIYFGRWDAKDEAFRNERIRETLSKD